MLLALGKSRGLRTIAIGVLTCVTAVALVLDNADARSRRHRAARGGGYNPPYAAIVVDANTGKVLHEAAADGIRHPASLTKIMTLYLLFERLEAGKLDLETPLKVSAHAAAQSPTKLGVKPGQTITVDQAIRGLVTRSANDAAVVIAEAIAGDEDDFAKMMTRKARALGMSKTVYRNASGLPNDDQVTTARDQALLGRAIQDRFPKQYKYFSIPSFTFRGSVIRNHNRLLGSVKGVDGIKTGFIRASGFNLVSSMRRNGRHLVAVVLGGRSSGARDAKMRSLLEKYIDDASPRRTAPLVAEAAGGADDTVVAVLPRPAPANRSEPAKAQPIDPIKPILVKTIRVKLDGTRTAAMTPPLAHMPVQPVRTHIGAIRPQAPAPQPTVAAVAPTPAPVAVAPATAPTPAARTVTVATGDPDATYALASASTRDAKQDTKRNEPEKVVRSGWIIQIGAFEAESEAKNRLDMAQSKAKSVLADADPFTETVVKDDRTFYRARFAGFERRSAEAACRYLKRRNFACLTIKN
ncbi:D-alanyl-D-alanine carboxypeptidase [Rhodovulum sp. PH10]|uniref:D-alanyl-D-alanine carboxypeptidase n=1 Tax=Rhodovulum sp. PH10 TaxID=1187851 RepID=UPI00068E9529|nr:D-alanyl-D-alanine carboxypeptidase [Rhodovulum sp. PH10]